MVVVAAPLPRLQFLSWVGIGIFDCLAHGISDARRFRSVTQQPCRVLPVLLLAKVRLQHSQGSLKDMRAQEVTIEAAQLVYSRKRLFRWLASHVCLFSLSWTALLLTRVVAAMVVINRTARYFILSDQTYHFYWVSKVTKELRDEKLFYREHEADNIYMAWYTSCVCGPGSFLTCTFRAERIM